MLFRFLTKPLKIFLIALAFFALLYLMAGQFLGPGLRDFSARVANGYEYDDAGGYEKSIIYRGSERKNEIVIDARVEDHILEGENLFVARRPREIYRDNDGVLESRLSPDCEYWKIDVKTHRIEKTTETKNLHCK
jgi:hypothetical protein